MWDEQKEKVIVEGESVQACLNKQGRVVRFPSEIIEKLNP
jgi:acyl-CoA thioesterase FadM